MKHGAIKKAKHHEDVGGYLIIIGGAEDKYNERRILRKFIALSGGEAAHVLVVPVASDYPEFIADIYTQSFRKLGVRQLSVLRATSRQEVIEADAEKLMDGVTGVFISGGDQMRLASILGGTEFARVLEERVRAGLTLAGSSAGAAGMSSSMIVRG